MQFQIMITIFTKTNFFFLKSFLLIYFNKYGCNESHEHHAKYKEFILIGSKRTNDLIFDMEESKKIRFRVQLWYHNGQRFCTVTVTPKVLEPVKK